MSDQPKKLNRRSFLTGFTVASAGAAVSAASACAGQEGGGASISDAMASAEPELMASVVEFDGPHQAGIATPGQALLNLVAFTVRADVDREGIRRLLKLWTDDARRLCAGHTPLGDLEPEMVTVPANMTITCGFGSKFFDLIGKPDLRPEWLAPLPAFSRDKLDDAWGEADIVLQLCADDPTTLAHATRHMIRAGVDYVATRWMQQGFLSAYGAHSAGETPRNLFGLKDGTVNPRSDADFDDIVWIDQGPSWVQGGTCMIVRRISMNMDTWEILDRGSREIAFGRKLDSGAPLTGDWEFDTPDYSAVENYGIPLIDRMSHMARSTNPVDKPGQKIARRAYNYDLPPQPGSEQSSNSGLVFICFQKDPREQFIPIQERLDEGDRINQWTTHIGSAVFFCPPGVDEAGGDRGKYWGAGLFDAA